MEKEQIIKALEYCTSGGACSECQYDENPLLSREGCMARKMFNALSIIREQDKRIKEVKADTVRKMQEAVKKRCIKGGIYPAFVASVIDQIAKEMLEGE